jgi:hypothetical protein
MPLDVPSHCRPHPMQSQLPILIAFSIPFSQQSLTLNFSE